MPPSPEQAAQQAMQSALGFAKGFVEWALMRMHPQEVLGVLHLGLKLMASITLPPEAPAPIVKAVQAAAAGAKAIDEAMGQLVVVAGSLPPLVRGGPRGRS